MNAEQHLKRADEYARVLDVERRAGESDLTKVLAGDQGHALRLVIAHSSAAIVAAISDLTFAIKEKR